MRLSTSLRTVTVALVALASALPALAQSDAASSAVANIQITHASAALASLGPVQVYFNQPETSTTPDATVSFQAASVFVGVTSGVPLAVRVRLVNPPPFGPQQVSFTAPALPDGRFVVSLVGIPDAALFAYAQNPDGIARSLGIVLAPAGANRAAGAGRAADVTVVVTNAVTDSPALDVVVVETGRVIGNDVQYAQAAPPVVLAPGTYRVEVRNAATGAVLRAVRFVLQGTEGTFAFTVSGFLNPSANQNGPPLAITATGPTGVANPGVILTGTDEAPRGGLALAVASPVRGAAVVRYSLAEAGPVRLVAVDALGRLVAVLADGVQAAGAHEAPLAAGLAPGVYLVRLSSGRSSLTRSLTVVR